MQSDYISKKRISEIRSLIKKKYRQESNPNDRRSIPQEKKSVFGDQIESRDEFSRDRDRILFSKAFRRLQHKAQVYTHEKGDHYRTRLTHTIETTQISRGITKNLCLNENLAEAIALGHDIGHTPFGHEGEKVLDDILRGNEDLNRKIRGGWPQIDFGGFKHNFNSVKILDIIEKRYVTTNGLNLTWQVLDAILKHTKVAKKGYEYDLARFIQHPEFIEPLISKREKIEFPMTLEGQIVNISDEIAQRQHDLDDGLRDAELDINNVIGTICTNIDAILNNKWKEIFQYQFNRWEKINRFQSKINAIFEEIKHNDYGDKDIRLKLIELINKLPNSKYTHEELLLILELRSKIILLSKATLKLSKTSQKGYQSTQLIRLIISYFIHDVTINTMLKIENLEKKQKSNKKSSFLIIFGGKRYFKEKIVEYSKTGEKFDDILNNYIENRIVNSFNVNRFDAKSNYIIKRLFAAYYENPKQMSKDSLRRLNEQILFNSKEYYDIQFNGGPKIKNILFSPEPEDPLKLSHVSRLIDILKLEFEFKDIITPNNFTEEEFWRIDEEDFWEDNLPRLNKKQIKKDTSDRDLEKMLFIKCLLENHYALLAVITDNISGMTDNYAKEEYKQLYLV